MSHAAEKRAALEEKLSKLTSEGLQARINEQKAKLEAEINELSQFKEYEGKVALLSLKEGIKVKVIILGYARQAFKRSLFTVTPLEGEGQANFSFDKLQILDEQPA